MKKVLIIFVITIAIFSNIISTCAGDSTWLLCHGDEYQDSLIIGKVTGTSADKLTLNVIRQVSTSYLLKWPICSSVLKVSYLPGELRKEESDLRVNDVVLASIKFTDFFHESGENVYGIYKVKLMNDKKIKIDKNKLNDGFIEWFVNTGDDNGYIAGSGKHLNSFDSKYKAPESGIIYNPLLLIIIPPIFIAGIILIAILTFLLMRKRIKRRRVEKLYKG